MSNKRSMEQTFKQTSAKIKTVRSKTKKPKRKQLSTANKDFLKSLAVTLKRK